MRLLILYILRAVCALAVGFLLVCNPSAMTSLLVQIIGGLFVLSGLMAFVGYFTSTYRTKRARQRLSALADVSAAEIRIPSPSTISLVVGIGSMALGVFLMLQPTLFIHILMYVLGGLLVLLAFYQWVALIAARRMAPLSISLFLMPLLIAAAGVLVVCHPMQTASLPFVILGVAYLLYGVTEFFYGLRIYRFQRLVDTQVAIEQETMPTTVTTVTEAEAQELNIPQE